MSTDILHLDSLSVSYGFRTAVQDITLSARQGRSLGLLGANGAGKTSTIRAALGMLRPKKGTARVFGLRAGDIKAFANIGFAPEDALPPDYLKAHEYLGFVGAFRLTSKQEKKTKVAELVEYFELPAKKKIHEYSKGMKRRLVLAQAFLGNPKFLILDEPLNGLDPLMIIKLRERLTHYRLGGGTILFSSHILSEVEATCTDVAILSKGKLVCVSDTENLVKEFGSVEKAFSAKVASDVT